MWGWTNSEFKKKEKLDTRDEELIRILDAAVRVKRREDRLRRTTRHLRTRAAKHTEADGGICEYSDTSANEDNSSRNLR